MKSPAGLKTRIKNLVRKHPQKAMSVTELQVAISQNTPGITKLQIKAAIKEMIKKNKEQENLNKSWKYEIAQIRGGNAIKYTDGGETTKKYTGHYLDIMDVIERDSNEVTKIFGSATHLIAYDVHVGQTLRGEWGRPDVIVAGYRKRESSRSSELHSIEFQEKNGFTPSNVAQAYYSGRGADKCWLLFDHRDWPKNSAQRKDHPNADSVKNFAEKLGVGLIYYRRLSHGASWHLVLKAKQQYPNNEDKKSFKKLLEHEKKEKQKLMK